SYGSIAFNPGAGLNGSEPSIGAHDTSAIGMDSRRLSTSDSRPSSWTAPTRRHSSVRPSNAIPFAVTRGMSDAAAGSATCDSGWFLPFLRKSKGTSVLFGRAGLVADDLDDVRVGQGGRVAERTPFGDVAQEPAHDL